MCSGVCVQDSVVSVEFRYAAALSRVRYSVGAKHSLFTKIRLHVPCSRMDNGVLCGDKAAGTRR